jgi:hypothetical protein
VENQENVTKNIKTLLKLINVLAGAFKFQKQETVASIFSKQFQLTVGISC